jgi:hypothetical protein
VAAICDTIPENAAMDLLPLSEADRRELDRRLAHLNQHKASGASKTPGGGFPSENPLLAIHGYFLNDNRISCELRARNSPIPMGPRFSTWEFHFGSNPIQRR